MCLTVDMHLIARVYGITIQHCILHVFVNAITAEYHAYNKINTNVLCHIYPYSDMQESSITCSYSAKLIEFENFA